MFRIEEVQLAGTAMFNPGPVNIGGVGGSGTRVVAKIIKALGIFVGDTVNKSYDNFLFPPPKTMFERRMDEANSKEWAETELLSFDKAMHGEFVRYEGQYHNWGWKVPTSFYMLKYTAAFFPALRYIHVIRHGLDMAFSKNRNQLVTWGPMWGIFPASVEDSQSALQYWIKANRYAIQQARLSLGERFLLVKYDDLCRQPLDHIDRISDFLGIVLTADEKMAVASFVVPPATIGRHKEVAYEELLGEELIREANALWSDAR